MKLSPRLFQLFLWAIQLFSSHQNLEYYYTNFAKFETVRLIEELAKTAQNEGNRLKALELLAKIQGLTVQRTESVNVNISENSQKVKINEMSTEELHRELLSRLKINAFGRWLVNKNVEDKEVKAMKNIEINELNALETIENETKTRENTFEMLKTSEIQGVETAKVEFEPETHQKSGDFNSVVSENAEKTPLNNDSEIEPEPETNARVSG